MDAWVMFLAFTCPLVFGAGLAVLASWVFDLATLREDFRTVLGTVGKLVTWFVGNSAVVMGGAWLANVSESLKDVKFATATILLSYVAGFGGGLLLKYARRGREQLLYGNLRRYLTEPQMKALIVIYVFHEQDYDRAADLVGLKTRNEFIDLLIEATTKLNRHAKGLLKALAASGNSCSHTPQ